MRQERRGEERGERMKGDATSHHLLELIIYTNTLHAVTHKMYFDKATRNEVK